MIFSVLFMEFFKIGLFAVGGGLVTIPFLFELTKKYSWFSAHELMDMIAVSQSTPGPIGVNMATYAGFKVAGLYGGCVATLGLVLPSLIIVILVSKLLSRYSQNIFVQDVMTAMRPAGIALILQAGIELFRLSVTDWFSVMLTVGFFVLIRFYKKSPIFYIILSAIVGVVLKL
jgi:chromate transporter